MTETTEWLVAVDTDPEDCLELIENAGGSIDDVIGRRTIQVTASDETIEAVRRLDCVTYIERNRDDIRPLETDAENRLLTYFEINEQELEQLHADTQRVLEGMFDEENIEYSPIIGDHVYAQFLRDALQTMDRVEWPPEPDSILTVRTPEEHFRQLCREMDTGGRSARTNASMGLSSIARGANLPAARAYVNTRLEQHYNSAPDQ